MKSKEEIKQLGSKYALTHEDVSDKLGKYLVSACFQDGYTQCQEDMAKDIEYWQGEFDHWHKQAMDMSDTSKVTRFEVIDENGRAYTQRHCKVELSYQDDGRTLKVFIKPLNKQD